MLDKIKAQFFDRRFILYGIIGASGAVIDFIVYTLLVWARMDPIIASIISVSCGIINNFVWNASFNFKKKDYLLRRFTSFYLVGCGGILLTVAIIFVFHDLFGIGPIVSKLISIPPVVVSQFLLNKTISFGEKTRKTKRQPSENHRTVTKNN